MKKRSDLTVASGVEVSPGDLPTHVLRCPAGVHWSRGGIEMNGLGSAASVVSGNLP